MSRLDSFVLRLAEKKMEMERSRRILHGDPVDDETLPHTTSIYGSKDYWETRFEDGCTVGASTEKGETNNEWYAGYDELEPILQRFTARNHRVLILGCGTSTLGEELAVRGFSRVEAVDYSENAILRMRVNRIDILKRFGHFHENAPARRETTGPQLYENQSQNWIAILGFVIFSWCRLTVPAMCLFGHSSCQR